MPFEDLQQLKKLYDEAGFEEDTLFLQHRQFSPNLIDFDSSLPQIIDSLSQTNEDEALFTSQLEMTTKFLTNAIEGRSPAAGTLI